MSSLVREYTQPYIKAVEEKYTSSNNKEDVISNNLKKFAIALEIIERHGLEEEYKKDVSSLKNEPVKEDY